MCGILFSLCSFSSQQEDTKDIGSFDDLFLKLQDANTSRGSPLLYPKRKWLFSTVVILGPDAQDSVHIHEQNIKLTFFGSELRLRGDESIIQPHRDLDGNVMCWNGEVCLKFLHDRAAIEVALRSLKD